MSENKSTFGSRVNTLCRIGILPEVKTRRDVAKFLIMNKRYRINIGTFARTYINVDPGAESEIEETFLKEREVLDEINKLTWSC